MKRSEIIALLIGAMGVGLVSTTSFAFTAPHGTKHGDDYNSTAIATKTPLTEKKTIILKIPIVIK